MTDAQGHREEDLLPVAIANLRRLAFFGLDTGLDRFSRLAHTKLGLDLHIEVENVTPNRMARQDIDPQVLRLVEPWIYLDQQLYNAARDQLEAET